MSLRRSAGSTPASRAALLITGLLALLALALPGTAGAQETQPESVLVCLADDDGSYVLLSVAPSRVAEYRRNPRNIVPAPVSGCPANVQDSSGGTGGSGSSGGSTDEPTPSDDGGSGTAGDEDSGSGSAGDEDSGSEDSADEPSGGSAGESESGGSDEQGSDERASEPSRLANTGSETWAVLGGGVLLIGLGSGIALRRRREA